MNQIDFVGWRFYYGKPSKCRELQFELTIPMCKLWYLSAIEYNISE